MRDEEVRTSHPSFGMVQFNRCQSTGHRLHGSALDAHFNTIRLSISTGEVIEGDIGATRYFADRQIVEVELSAAQFAELITTMNVSAGVPCTIRRNGGVSVPEPPVVTSETTRAHDDFREKLKVLGKRVRKLGDDVHRLTEAKNLTNTSRIEIRKGVDKVVQEVESNMAYYLELFQEAAGRVTVAAKTEADAWITRAIHMAGVKSLGLGEAPTEEGSTTNTSTRYLTKSATLAAADERIRKLDK